MRKCYSLTLVSRPIRSANAETDVLGRRLDLDRPPERIVSLVPSLTETLFALGLEERIVGVTDFCIFPTIPPEIPRLGGTKKPAIETIRALRPDLVYVNVEENLRRHAEEIEKFAPLFATEPSSVGDVRDLIAQLGRIHDRGDEATDWIRRIDSIIARAEPERSEFSFACPIWQDPWMWCGGDTYVSDLIVTAGGVNVIGGRTRYPRIALDEVLSMKPDLILLPDEPYVFGESDRDALTEMGFSNVIGPFPGHLVTWHGTRTAAGLEYLFDAVKSL